MYIWLLVFYFFLGFAREVSRKSFLEILVQNGGTYKGSKLKRKQIGDEKFCGESFSVVGISPHHHLSGGEKGCSSGTTSQTDLGCNLCGTE